MILRSIYENKVISQRDIAKLLDVSLGKVNNLFKVAENNKRLIITDGNYKLTKNGKKFIEDNKVEAAVIIANEKLVNIGNYEFYPIGLRKLDAHNLIEKNIKLLMEKNINDIYIVAGNMIEAYEYLIDEYNIHFIYDGDYEKKGTLSKLLKARKVCEEKNVYVLLSNVYLNKNIFHEWEIESYIYANYMKDLEDNMNLLVNGRNVLVGVQDGGEETYAKTSIMFLRKEYSNAFFKLLNSYDKLPSANSFSYEDALIRNLDILPEMFVYKINEPIYKEIKSDIDFLVNDKTNINLNRFPMNFVTNSFKIKEQDVEGIEILDDKYDKKYFSFSIFKREFENKKYIVKVVGEIEKISRDVESEKVVYEELKDNNWFEKILYVDDKGSIIKEVFDGYRKILLDDYDDRKVALHMLRKIHNSNINITKEMDIEKIIDIYMSAIEERKVKIIYKDFFENLLVVKKLIYFLNGGKRPKVICKNFINEGDICYTSNGIKVQNIDTITLADPFMDIAAVAACINLHPDEIMKIYDEYNNMVDIENIAILNIDKIKARNCLICYLAIQYFIMVVKIILRENLYMIKEKNESFIKYRLLKNCIEYLKKNKII